MSGDLDANAAERVARAAAARRRVRSDLDAGAAGTSWADVVTGVAERGDTVTVSTTITAPDGQRFRGVVAGVGADAVMLESPNGFTMVRTDAVSSIRVHGRSPDRQASDRWATAAWASESDEAQGSTWHMADILARDAADRPRISVWAGCDQVVGTLVSTGTDLVVVATDGGGELAYVRLDSATAVSWASPSVSSSW